MTNPVKSAPRVAVGEFIFALALAVLGAVTLVGAGDIYEPPGGNVGPRDFPYAVGALLLVFGVILCVQVLRGKTGEAEVEEDLDVDAATDWLTVGLLIGAVVAHVFLITPLGWPVAAFVLFTAAAWTLGGRPLWRIALIAAVLALLIQFLFAYVLGLSLPAGPLFENVRFLHG